MVTPEEEAIIAYREEAASQLKNLPLLRDWLDLRDEHPKNNSRRAFIVEFAGMPKAGKSSVIENLRHFFSHGFKVKVGDKKGYVNSPQHRYEVHTPAEGVSLRTPGFLKSNLVDYNTWAGAYGLQELLQASHDIHHDLVILDRGPWDAGCWLEYWKTTNTDDGHVQQIANFFQMEHWMLQSDLHVVLVVDPSVAAGREQKSRLIAHGGFTSNTEGMNAMHNIYSGRFAELQAAKAKSCVHVGELSAKFFDTSKLDSHRVTLDVIRAVFDVLNAKATEYAADITLDAEWIESTMDGYLPNVRTTRKKILEFLPPFLEQANALSPLHRFRLRRLISQSRAPSDLTLSARAPKSESDSPLRTVLMEILGKVRST